MADKITIKGQVYSTTQNRGLPGVVIIAYENGQKLGAAQSNGEGNFAIVRCSVTSWQAVLNAVRASQNLAGTNLSFEVHYPGGQTIAPASSAFEHNNALFVYIPIAYPPVENTVALNKKAMRALETIASKPNHKKVLKDLKDSLSEIAELTPTSGDSGGRSSRSRADGDLQATVDNAFTNVLGRNLKIDNVKTFTASLERAFPGEQQGDKTKYVWNPRTYAVLSELGGGLSGAQASIYHQAHSAWEDIEPLLNNLTSIDPNADVEEMEAVRAILRTEMVELVNELGYEGGPRVQRVDYIFSAVGDKKTGLVKQLRDAFKIDRSGVITVEDEEQYTHLIMIEERIKALKQSWKKIKNEFINTQQKYLGTQLVLISRSLAVVADAVEETTNVMDSVGLGPSERKTLMLDLGKHKQMLLGDLLEWVQTFASDEGPTLAVDGGIRGVETIYGIAKKLKRLVTAASKAQPNHNDFKSRVRSSLKELARHLDDVRQRAKETLPPKP